MATYSIESLQFIAIQGWWIPPQEQLQIEQRAGVDGVELTQKGLHSEPFTLRSQVDATDYAAAVAALDTYVALVDDDPVIVVLGDESSADHGFNCQVLRVRAVDIRKISGSLGGLNPPSEGWIEAAWDMVAVPSGV